GDRSGPPFGSPSPSFWERGLGVRACRPGTRRLPGQRSGLRIRPYGGCACRLTVVSSQSRRNVMMTPEGSPGVLTSISSELAGVVEQVAPSVVRVDDGSRLTATGIIWAADGR